MISKPRYRFFLDGTKQISEPIGWNSIKIELNRDTKYWSLVESIELPFEFYGEDAEGDGGYEYLLQARANGPDAQVEFLAQISWDAGSTWETFFSGLLDLTTLLEIQTKRRFQCGIVRENNWSRFVNLEDNAVAISDADNIDHTVTLPSQKMRQLFVGISLDGIVYDLPPQAFIIFDLPVVSRNEITRKYNLPRSIVPNGDPPAWIFEMDFAGDYNFDGEVIIQSNSTPSSSVPNIEMYIQINEDAAIAWTKTNIGTDGIDGQTRFTYDVTHALDKGDIIRLYFRNTSLAVTQELVVGAASLTVTADTTYPASTAPGFYIHDVAQNIIQENTGNVYFYSDYFGGVDTYQIDYSSDGCGVYFHLFKGLHLRNRPLSIKPFSISWNELWEGINPIFCLGVGYETKSFSVFNGSAAFNRETLVMMPREYFFDPTPSIELFEYNRDFRLEIKYDTQFLITSFKIGYQKWQAQSSQGNDDPQTSHRYTTRFKTVGDKDTKDKPIMSTMVAASLTIEQGRRLSEILAKDWPFDEDTFIVQGTSSLSPSEVRLYASEPITGLDNAETRYNVRLTPASNLNRWNNWLSIAFQEYPGAFFTFRDGEGNTSMTFNDPAATGCDAEAGTFADESGDVEISQDVSLLPLSYKFQMALSWEQYKTIRDNRRKAFILTYRLEGEEVSVTLFVNKMAYFPNSSRADFECWLKSIALGTTVTGVLDGFGTWTVEDGAVTFDAFQLQAPVDSETINVSGLVGTVDLFVGKDTNGGLAEADGEVRFYRNGILEPGTDVVGTGEGTQTFVNTGNVSTVLYQYTSVVETDVLRVEIQEG